MTSTGFLPKRLGRSAAFLGLLAGLWLTTPSSRAEEPRTVKEYYLAVPESFGLLSEALRRKQLAKDQSQPFADEVTIDDARGYLAIEPAAAGDSFHFVVWPRKEGGAVVAFTSHHEGLEKGKATYETSELKFLRYEPGGKWRDITREVIGGRTQRDCGYLLPRQGTTVKVVRRGRTLYELAWNAETGRLTRQRLR